MKAKIASCNLLHLRAVGVALCLLLLLHRQLAAALLSNWGYVHFLKETIGRDTEFPIHFLCDSPKAPSPDDNSPVGQAKVFARAISWNPSATSAWQGLGLSHLTQGHYREAADSFSQVASSSIVAEFLRGVSLAGNHDYLSAIEAWRFVRAGKYFLRTGINYSMQGDSACAEKLYQLSLEIDPQNPDTYYALANLYWGLGREDLNIRALEAGLAIDERLSGTRSFYQGQLAYLQGRYDEAARYYEDSLRYEDQPDRVYRFLGLAMWRKGDLRMATLAFQKQIDANGDIWAYIFSGRVYLEMKDCDQSIKILGQATEHSPNNAAAWGWLGTARLSCGLAHQAIPALSKAVALDPQNLYRKALADAYRNTGQVDLACSEYGEALKLKFDDEIYRLMEKMQCPHR